MCTVLFSLLDKIAGHGNMYYKNNNIIVSVSITSHGGSGSSNGSNNFYKMKYFERGF
jgi:hypothetical protein